MLPLRSCVGLCDPTLCSDDEPGRADLVDAGASTPRATRGYGQAGSDDDTEPRGSDRALLEIGPGNSETLDCFD